MKAEDAKLIKKRANGYCEKCGGKAVAVGMVYHHRKLRSRGGKDTPSNFLRIHWACHTGARNSIHENPELATDKGWMVPSWKEPHEWPLTKPNGAIVLLQDDGTEIVLEEGMEWK